MVLALLRPLFRCLPLGGGRGLCGRWDGEWGHVLVALGEDRGERRVHLTEPRFDVPQEVLGFTPRPVDRPPEGGVGPEPVDEDPEFPEGDVPTPELGDGVAGRVDRAQGCLSGLREELEEVYRRVGRGFTPRTSSDDSAKRAP